MAGLCDTEHIRYEMKFSLVNLFRMPVAPQSIPAHILKAVKEELTQSAFAKLMSVSVRTLPDWEQGKL